MSTPENNIYILLLGASGSGKTSLINMLAQIMTYKSLDDAIDSKEPMIPVPNRRTEYYPDGTSEDILYRGFRGEDVANERFGNIGSSFTQSPRMYSFKNGNTIFNFIDMPGFGDTSWNSEDEINKKKRYAFLETVPQIHAIVTVVKATENMLSQTFIGSLDDVLSMVPKSAAANLIFFATFSLGSSFQGNLIAPVLQRYLADVNNKYKVQLSLKDNVFYIDNFALLYLLSYTRSEKYRKFTDAKQRADADLCWQKTKEAIKAMARKVLTLPGIPAADIAAFNFARTLIDIVTENLIKFSDEALKLSDPKFRAAQAQKMQAENPTLTTKQIDTMLTDGEKRFKQTLFSVYQKASQELLKPAGFLKHHCVAPMSNGYRVRLQNKIIQLESDADFDGAAEVQAELDAKDKHNRCFELILNNATRISTLEETCKAPEGLLKLQIIGKDVKKAFEAYQKTVKFEFKDTVPFTATYPIQNDD
uniref:Phage protein n=2 Tax=Panagrellus redivivus TaxID=6233 RepID=A0A7E4W6T2_PANRE